MDDVDISIIVVNWKVRDLLRDCLRSVEKAVGSYSHEVVVVDNDSRDGSVEMMREEFPEVTLTANAENVGLTSAVNQAIPVTRGRHVLLLNPDVALHDNALQRMATFLDENPRAGAVGGKELRPDGTFNFRCRRRWLSPLAEMLALFGANRIRLHPLWGQLFRDEWMRDVPIDRRCRVGILALACLMVRREVFESIGVLDESFWGMSEDVDFCLRMGRAGWQIWYLPEAEYAHHHGQSTRQSMLDMRLVVVGERWALFRKHWGWATATAYRGAVLLAGNTRLVMSAVMPLAGRDRGRLHLRVGRDFVGWAIRPTVTPSGHG